MKPALLITVVAAVLLAAFPALACRIPSQTVRAEAAMPRVGFTASVSAAVRTHPTPDLETIGVILQTRETLSGSPPAQTSLYGVLSEEIVVHSCGPVRPYPHEMALLTEGSVVIVSGVQSPDGGLIIQAAAPVRSERGQTLLAQLRSR